MPIVKKAMAAEVSEGVPPGGGLGEDMTAICQMIRLTQQLDAGCTSDDIPYLVRVATELALGDPMRGIKQWDRADFGQSAVDFIKHLGTVEDLELPAPVQVALGFEAAPEIMQKAKQKANVKARRGSVLAHSREVYQVIKKTTCRAGCEIDTEKSGSLQVGDVIDVLETRATKDGVMRIKSKVGWVSLVSSGGENLLKKVSPEDAPLLKALQVVKNSGGIRKLEDRVWTNYVENLEKPQQKECRDQKKRAVSAKATAMSKDPYHRKLKLAVEFGRKGGFTQDEMHVIRTMTVTDANQEGGQWCTIQYLEGKALKASLIEHAAQLGTTSNVAQRLRAQTTAPGSVAALSGLSGLTEDRNPLDGYGDDLDSVKADLKAQANVAKDQAGAKAAEAKEQAAKKSAKAKADAEAKAAKAKGTASDLKKMNSVANKVGMSNDTKKKLAKKAMDF